MMCKNINKNKRGFSLVELMVVVAIMGTLAAIAIPAYNEYRRSAKKAAYKSDLNSLHKGWLAFGVELDSFCERETEPSIATIGDVGMRSLLSSKLYGGVSSRDATCVGGGGGTLDPAGCNAMLVSGMGACTGCNATDPLDPPTFISAREAGGGPGKHNFIGFGAQASGCLGDIAGRQIVGAQGSQTTSPELTCVLGVTNYRMAVYGHFGGIRYYGVSINDEGVLSDESIKESGLNQASSNCT